MYKVRNGAKGRPLYYHNGKLVSPKVVPPAILLELATKNEFEDEVPQVAETEPRLCIFCGMGCKLQRIVNGHSAWLCEDHFYSTNLGQTAQRIRELAGSSQ